MLEHGKERLACFACRTFRSLFLLPDDTGSVAILAVNDVREAIVPFLVNLFDMMEVYMAAGLDGVLHWAYNSWVETPLQDSRFRTWPAGDTYIVYPQNRSSIRFERMLEGIQDYEKVALLRKKWTDTKDQDKLRALDAAIKKLDNPK